MIVRQQLDNKYRIDIVISDQVCEILLFHHDRGWERKKKKLKLTILVSAHAQASLASEMLGTGKQGITPFWLS
jgi:hypothetical protein